MKLHSRIRTEPTHIRFLRAATELDQPGGRKLPDDLLGPENPVFYRLPPALGAPDRQNDLGIREDPHQVLKHELEIGAVEIC